MQVSLKVSEVRNRIISYLQEKLELAHEDAVSSTDHLIRCQQAGKDCHGLVRVKYLTESGKFGPYSFKPSPKPEYTSHNTLFADGSDSLGYPVLDKLVKTACEAAEEKGNCFFNGLAVYPSGAISDWAGHACDKGMASIIMAGSPPRVGFPGPDQLLGTNPICIGIPSEPCHFISDTATSHITHGSLLLAQQNNTELPDGAAVNNDGDPEKDASKVNPSQGLGALLPVGGSHKTFALSMAIELLTSIAGGIPGSKKVKEHGVFGIIFKAEIHEEITNALKNWNSRGIRIPGWNSGTKFKEHSQKGIMNIDSNTLNELMKCLEN